MKYELDDLTREDIEETRRLYVEEYGCADDSDVVKLCDMALRSLSPSATGAIGEVVGHNWWGQALVKWEDGGLRPIGMKLYAAPSLPVEEKTTGWISVKDRLPGAEFEWVLVAAEFDAPGDWRIKIGALNRDMSTGWKILGASWTPTHWMPLPCAPDMKQHESPQGED